MTTYTKRWFAGQVANSLSSADIVAPMAVELLRPRSIVDVGCGMGAWLAGFIKAGVTDVLGIDGEYVDRSMLAIPAEKFQAHDLTKPLSIARGFDLAVSVEVAEHLPEAAAEQFVAALTTLAPVVLFSAALPGQGGNRHVNEQWPSYWAARFAARGYAVADPFRPALWTNQGVEWWYRQNMLLYISPERLRTDADLRRLVGEAAGRPLDIVHPEMFQVARDQAASPARTLVHNQVVVVKQAIKRVLPGQ